MGGPAFVAKWVVHEFFPNTWSPGGREGPLSSTLYTCVDVDVLSLPRVSELAFFLSASPTPSTPSPRPTYLSPTQVSKQVSKQISISR